MKRQQWGLYAVALAVLVVGLVWAGVPASTLLIAGLILVCPLMMFVMMRGMHGGGMTGHQGHDSPHEGHQHHDATDDHADGPHGAGRR
jgi:hypothetical protein